MGNQTMDCRTTSSSLKSTLTMTRGLVYKTWLVLHCLESHIKIL